MLFLLVGIVNVTRSLETKQQQPQKKIDRRGGRERNRMTGKAYPNSTNVPMFYYDTFDDEENNTRARILNKTKQKLLFFIWDDYSPLPL